MYDNAALSGWWHGPYQHGRRQPRGHPPEHDRAQEHDRHAGREPGIRWQHATGRGHAARQPQPQVVRVACARSSRRSSTTGRAGRGSTKRSSSRSRYQRRTSAVSSVRGSYPWGRFPRASRCTSCPDRDDDPADNPAVEPNQSTQPEPTATDYVNPARIIEAPPCGYFITEAQYSGPAIRSARRWRCGSTRTASRRRRGRAGTSSGSRSRCVGLIPMMFDTSSVTAVADRVGARG